MRFLPGVFLLLLSTISAVHAAEFRGKVVSPEGAFIPGATLRADAHTGLAVAAFAVPQVMA